MALTLKLSIFSSGEFTESYLVQVWISLLEEWASNTWDSSEENFLKEMTPLS